MVDRPADVLPMNPAKPPVLSTFTRADMAIRRMPGLGLIIVAVLLQYEYEHGNAFGIVCILGGIVAMLALEFAPKRWFISGRASGRSC